MDLIDGCHAQHIHHDNGETADRAEARTTELFEKAALKDMSVPQVRERIAVGEIAHLAAGSQSGPQAGVLAHELVEGGPQRFDLRGQFGEYREFVDGDGCSC